MLEHIQQQLGQKWVARVARKENNISSLLAFHAALNKMLGRKLPINIRKNNNSGHQKTIFLKNFKEKDLVNLQYEHRKPSVLGVHRSGVELSGYFGKWHWGIALDCRLEVVDSVSLVSFSLHRTSSIAGFLYICLPQVVIWHRSFTCLDYYEVWNECAKDVKSNN